MDKTVQSSSTNIQKPPSEYFRIALNDFREITGIDITPDQEARLFIRAGKMCDLSGDWDQALEQYEKAIKTCENDQIRAEALKQTGHVKSKRGEWQAALEVYKASLEIMHKLGNLHEIGNVYKDIGYNHFEMGHMALAKEYYGRALETAEKCDDAQLVADVHNNLGILSNVKGQIDEAISHYQQSIAGYQAISDNYGLAQAYHNLAMAQVDIGEWKSAGEHYQKSMELCMEIGDMDFLSVIYINRAQLALHLHDPFVAKLYCDKAFETFHKTGSNEGLAESYRIYGIIHSIMWQQDSAESFFQKGIESLGEYENHPTKAEIYYELGSMKLKQDEKEKASKYLKKALAIYEALGVDKEVSKITAQIQKIAP